MIRAFTGPTELTPRQRRWAAQRMLGKPAADLWRSGCAPGTDTIAAWLAVALDVELELYIPFAPHNAPMVHRLAPEARVIRCPKAATRPASYRIRNKMLVEGAGHLLALVWKDSFYRSGEWMTINIAKDLGVPFDIKVIPQELG